LLAVYGGGAMLSAVEVTLCYKYQITTAHSQLVSAQMTQVTKSCMNNTNCNDVIAKM